VSDLMSLWPKQIALTAMVQCTKVTPLYIWVLIRLRARNIRVGPTLPGLKTPPLKLSGGIQKLSDFVATREVSVS
jgi:hypothetical protein